ncbi:hypothetical protein [Rudanella lutea]|uniref:hypothetical protein n=1 Tax=Rudanella lutea TaxID=451374 RepID=UPI0003657CEF|nr:hypothetical protein [Rudanella lutea]
MKTFICLLLLLPALAWGQDTLPARIGPGPVLKLAPLSLLSPDPTVQAAVELPLTSRLSVQPGIGVGGTQVGPGVRAGSPSESVQARTEIRYYISPALGGKLKSGRSPGGFYVAGEGALNRQKLKIPREGALSATEMAQVNRHIYGLNAKVGYQQAPIAKLPRFIVDVYVGVGYRIVSVRQVGSTDSSTLRKPGVTAGVSIGWMINSGKKVPRK